MKLSGVEQEILISNGNFDKNEFRLSLCSTVTELYGRRYGEMRRKRISKSLWKEGKYEDYIGR